MIMPSVAKVKFIKTRLFLGNQVSSNSDHEIKSYSCSNPRTKMGEKKEKNFWVTKRGNKRLQIGAGFKNYRSGKRDYK